jgi:pilus assembly protein CpaE
VAETINVRIETKNPDLKKLLVTVIHTIEGLQVELSQADDNLDLLICDIGQDVENDFGHILFLMSRNKNAKVFLTSADTDPSLLMRAIRIGAKEFFPQPLNIDELREAFRRIDITTSRRVGEVLTVMGCKGGVGTTCVAVNLAVALQRQHTGASVALVDMNLVFGEIPLFLNFKPRYTWAEVAKHINRMDDVFLSDNLFEHTTGIHVLPSPSMWKSSEEATPPIFMRILSHMRRLFDYIVIDVGHTFSDMNMKTLENSNRVFLVSLLSLPCLSNTSKLLSSFDSWGFPSRNNTHIIINRYLQNSEISLEDCEKSINKKILWKFPNDYDLTMTAINQGRSLYEVDEKAVLTKSFAAFAKEIAPQPSSHKADEGMFSKNLSRFKTLFRGSK